MGGVPRAGAGAMVRLGASGWDYGAGRNVDQGQGGG